MSRCKKRSGKTPYRDGRGLLSVRSVKTHFHLGRLLPAISLMALLAGLISAHLNAADGDGGAVNVPQTKVHIDRAEVPLFLSSHDRLDGALAKRDYLIRLPEHVRFEPGSELVLSYRSSPLLVPDVSTLSVRLNDRELTSVRLGSQNGETQGQNTLTIPIKTDMLLPGWNRISLGCLLQTTEVMCRDVDNPAAWLEVEPGSALRFSYSSVPLFPEIQRFPHALTEPQLLSLTDHSVSNEDKKHAPVVSVLMPWDAGESELRAFLICAARMGQTGYLRPESIATADLSAFDTESRLRNGILIATKEALASVDLPPDLKSSIANLRNGEGLLAEIIIGDPGYVQRRWMVLSGGDAEGLEKVALTVGSATALRNATSNPLIVTEEPMVSPIEEKMAQPKTGAVKLGSLQGGNMLMRGLFRQSSERPVDFPPGFQTTSRSYVDLDFSHAGNLEKTSAFDVKLNDLLIGSISLTPENANQTHRRLAIPAGITGRDHSRLSVSAYLDIGRADCTHIVEERAWLNIAASSKLDINSEPLEINDLSRIGLLCQRDAFLRRAAIIVPELPDKERDELIKTIGLTLGKQLATMPILWPQLATYAPGIPATPSRVAKRSGLVLGSAFQWSEALPTKTTLVIKAADGKNESLSLRGETMPVDDFDPSMAFAQLIPSPWTQGEIFATVGGVSGYGGDSAIAMLTDTEVCERLTGTVAAVDDQRRIVTYDVRYIQEMSLSEQMTQGFAPGVSKEEVENQKIETSEALVLASIMDKWLIIGAIFTLALLFLVQRLAVRRRDRKNKGRDL